MRIIFDDVEEKEEFFIILGESAYCPRNPKTSGSGDCENYDCKGCWTDMVPHEIKES